MTTNYQALSVEVTGLQKEMGEVKSTVGLLSGKIDSAVSNLAGEMRRAIDALGSTINERAKTPWAVIWAGLSVIVVLIGFIGNQALSPILIDIKDLKTSIVSRTEHETRWLSNDVRMNRDEVAIAQMQANRYAEQQNIIDRLRNEAAEGEKRHLSDMQDQINKTFVRDRDNLVKSNEDLRTDNRQLRGLKP